MTEHSKLVNLGLPGFQELLQNKELVELGAQAPVIATDFTQARCSQKWMNLVIQKF